MLSIILLSCKKCKYCLHLQVDNIQLISSSFKHFQEKSCMSNKSKFPKSPWMPFSMLFAAISTKISPHDMNLVSIHYDEFKVCLSFCAHFMHFSRPFLYISNHCLFLIEGKHKQDWPHKKVKTNYRGQVDDIYYNATAV